MFPYFSRPLLQRSELKFMATSALATSSSQVAASEPDGDVPRVTQVLLYGFTTGFY